MTFQRMDHVGFSNGEWPLLFWFNTGSFFPG